MRKRKLIRKVKPAAFGRKVEIDYTRDLLAISELCKAEGESSWKMVQGTGFIGDSAFLGDAPWWVTSIANKFDALGNKVKLISNNLASKVVYGQADLTDKELSTHIKKATGVDVEGLVSPSRTSRIALDSINANVSLIESIPKEYHQRLERILLAGIQEGRSQEYIADKIKKLGDITDNRALLIARDQAGKLAGQFGLVRLKALGFKTYLWDTKGDSRVRREHAKRQNIRFSIDDPPYDGHPGQPISCRCRPLPDFDGLMNDDGPSILRNLILAGKGFFSRK